jgi:hypothetical protein
MISEQTLRDAERIVRITMIVILLTADTSKLFSQGGFSDYYAQSSSSDHFNSGTIGPNGSSA